MYLPCGFNGPAKGNGWASIYQQDGKFAFSRDHDDTLEAHYASLERPHACYGGIVYIGHLVEDPGTGEEAEILEAVPCRRCADSLR